MISKCAILVYFSLSFGFLEYAQTPEIDSLKRVYSNSQVYADQLDLLHKITLKATYSNLDTAEIYGNRLLTLSLQDDPNEFRGKAYLSLSDIARRRSQLDLALLLAKKADSLAESGELKAKILNLFGNVYFYRDQYEDAILNYKSSLALATKVSAFEDVVKNLSNLGMAYFRKGEYADALASNLRAIKYIDSLGLSTKRGSIYGVIGVVYQNMGEYNLAYDHYRKAITSDSIFGDPMGVITWRINWAIALEGEGKFQEAEQVYKASLVESERYKFATLTANVMSNMGALYKKMNQTQKSLEVFQRAYEYADSIGAFHLMSFDIQNLGGMYLDLKDPESARPYLMKGRAMAYQVNDPAFKRDIHAHLATYFRQIKSYDSAFFHIEKHVSFKDSILNESKIKEVGKVEAQYEYEKEKLIREKEFEKQLLVEQEKQKTQQLILLIVSVSALVIMILLVIIYRKLKQTSFQKLIIEKQKQEVEIQSQKLQTLDAAKTNFFSNISHDLRSPLTLILGSIDQIVENEAQNLSLSSKELLDATYRNSKKLLFMADEIRDLTRLQEGKLKLKPQSVRITGYLNLLVKMFSSAALMKRVILRFDSGQNEDVIVSIDPHQFEKVIYNLLSNAVKHTQELGEITVSISQGKSPDKILIAISDTGIGIPENQLTHIFERFYQLPNSVDHESVGMGIGLALSKEIVDLHFGKIWAESSEGKGSVFKIELPRATGVADSQAIVDEYYDPVFSKLEYVSEKEDDFVANPGKSKILLVEDHREIRQYITNLISAEFEVHIARNGEEGLRKLANEKVDLVISDIMMPFMDGFEFIRQLKEQDNYKHIPILIISARTAQSDKEELLALGADGILAKPFSPAELKLRIQNLLKRTTDNRILKIFEPTNTRSNLDNIISRKLEEFILERVDDPNLSIIDLTDLLAASERKVFRLIKRIFDLTPLELIKETRWKYLDTLIKKQNKLTATEAARAIGLSNVTYFRRQFADHFKMDFEAYSAQFNPE